jgi:hypothetical protein
MVRPARHYFLGLCFEPPLSLIVKLLAKTLGGSVGPGFAVTIFVLMLASACSADSLPVRAPPRIFGRDVMPALTVRRAMRCRI